MIINVLVQMTKHAGTASRWIRVVADNQKVAIKLAEGAAKSAPSVVKAVGTMVRVIK